MKTGAQNGAIAAVAVAGGAAEVMPQGMRHDPEAKRKIVNRLRRAQGQLGAVLDAIERDDHCRDIVQQLSAVSKAIDRAGFLVISSALQECLTNPDVDGAPDRDELEKLFLSLA